MYSPKISPSYSIWNTYLKFFNVPFHLVPEVKMLKLSSLFHWGFSQVSITLDLHSHSTSWSRNTKSDGVTPKAQVQLIVNFKLGTNWLKGSETSWTAVMTKWIGSSGFKNKVVISFFNKNIQLCDFKITNLKSGRFPNIYFKFKPDLSHSIYFPSTPFSQLFRSHVLWCSRE